MPPQKTVISVTHFQLGVIGLFLFTVIPFALMCAQDYGFLFSQQEIDCISDARNGHVHTQMHTYIYI